MKKLLALILLLPVAILIIAFSVANRHSTTVSFDPTTTVDAAPALAFTVPLWMLLFGTLVLGVIVGGASAWASQHRYRSEARTKRHEANKWHKEAEAERERAEQLADEKLARTTPANDDGDPARVRRPLPALAAPGR